MCVCLCFCVRACVYVRSCRVRGYGSRAYDMLLPSCTCSWRHPVHPALGVSGFPRRQASCGLTCVTSIFCICICICICICVIERYMVADSYHPMTLTRRRMIYLEMRHGMLSLQMREVVHGGGTPKCFRHVSRTADIVKRLMSPDPEARLSGDEVPVAFVFVRHSRASVSAGTCSSLDGHSPASDGPTTSACAGAGFVRAARESQWCATTPQRSLTSLRASRVPEVPRRRTIGAVQAPERARADN